ncbi:hypothetical protein ERJ75_000736700 [Trypanosoma vivax]|uniref:Putative zinc-binding protein (Yippee) n=1 Tax=Trypanosoma vivax (strain Y486) TaxID=1055687 RepID=G0TXD5_TRYVY|nr:putative zinc-binding protein (Yippee) [Trypanosoma vivax]KAH8614133.1 hypothetical protein ERJ75_000736700 [Trypanosoma vivax]CCC48625.1 putative zinc-binding protein (Yippee) [Trypanosoma vivax Y486]
MGAALRVLCNRSTLILNRAGNESRKRRRSVRDVQGADAGALCKGNNTPPVVVRAATEALTDSGAQSLMRMELLGFTAGVSAPLCRTVLHGTAVEDTYGCHYHAYSSESPNEAHGTSLCWNLQRSPIGTHELLCLGRLANNCRKNVVLFDNGGGIMLSYRASL